MMLCQVKTINTTSCSPHSCKKDIYARNAASLAEEMIRCFVGTQLTCFLAHTQTRRQTRYAQTIV